MAVPPHGLPEYNRMIPHGGDTALMFAARVGDLGVGEAARGRRVRTSTIADAWGVSATTLAAFAGHGEIARLLLEKGADPNVDGAGFTALHCAIMRRDETTVAALLARGADPNIDGEGVDADAAIVRRLPLHARAGRGNALLAGRAVHAAGRHATARQARRRSASHPRVALRARRGLSAPQGGRRRRWRPWGWAAATPWVACPRGERGAALETVKLAAELGVDVNVANIDGRTALDAAKAQKLDAVAASSNRGACRRTSSLDALRPSSARRASVSRSQSRPLAASSSAFICRARRQLRQSVCRQRAQLRRELSRYLLAPPRGSGSCLRVRRRPRRRVGPFHPGDAARACIARPTRWIPQAAPAIWPTRCMAICMA